MLLVRFPQRKATGQLLFRTGFMEGQLRPLVKIRMKSYNPNYSNSGSNGTPNNSQEFDTLHQFQRKSNQPQPFQGTMHNQSLNLSNRPGVDPRFIKNNNGEKGRPSVKPRRRPWTRILGFLLVGSLTYVLLSATLVVDEMTDKYHEFSEEMHQAESKEGKESEIIAMLEADDVHVDGKPYAAYYEMLISIGDFYCAMEDYETANKIFKKLAFFLIDQLYSENFDDLSRGNQAYVIYCSLAAVSSLCYFGRKLNNVNDLELHEQLLLLNIIFAEAYAATFNSTLYLGRALDQNVSILRELQSFKHRFAKDGNRSLEGEWMLPPYVSQEDVTKTHLKDYTLSLDAWPMYSHMLVVAKEELICSYVCSGHYSLALRELSTLDSYLGNMSEATINGTDLLKLGLMSLLKLSKDERCKKLAKLKVDQTAFLKANLSKLQEIEGINGISHGDSSDKERQLSNKLRQVVSDRDLLLSVKRAELNIKTIDKTLKYYESIDKNIQSEYKRAYDYEVRLLRSKLASANESARNQPKDEDFEILAAFFAANGPNERSRILKESNTSQIELLKKTETLPGHRAVLNALFEFDASQNDVAADVVPGAEERVL